MRRTRVVAALAVLASLAVAAPASAAEAPELTNSGGDLRTGWYPNEPEITPELVSGGTFGQLWSAPVEGQVYAQPLLDDGALLVATEENDLYGLEPSTGAQKWTRNLGEPWNPGEIHCADLSPWVGVTSTPVIDPATHVAYLTYKTYTSGQPAWYMEAVNVATGAKEPGFPVRLGGAGAEDEAQNKSPTHERQHFEAKTQLQRPGLLLMEGVVYAAFGSDCDTPNWQGWVFGVSASTGKVTARWVADESGDGAGIWQSGAGLTSEGPGTILLSTGNGGAPSKAAAGDEPPEDLGESIVHLQVQSNGELKATDFFAPYDATSLDTWDADFASGGVTGLPEEYFGTLATPRLAVAVGKDGYVYLLDREDLGGIDQGPGGSDDVVQRIGPYGGVWSRPGVWPGEGGWVYIPTASDGTTATGSSGNLRVYQYGLTPDGSPALSLQGTSKEAFGYSSSAPVITSNGTAEGSALVWVVWAPNGTGEGAQLQAYDPIPVDGEPVLRWSAPIGTSSKFATPGVGAGRLYVGTRDGHVLAFGSPVTPVLSGSPTTFPTTTVGESSQRTLTLTATEPLTVTKLESSSSQFRIDAPTPPLPAKLGTGQTIEIPIVFSPAGTGPIGGILSATTESGKKASFGLSGSGQASAAQLEASPLVLQFPGTVVDREATEGATFRNVGGAPLTIEKTLLPEAPFEVESQEVPKAGDTIEPGRSITINVSFKPTAEGTFEQAVGLETSAGTAEVQLSGTAAQAGALRVSSETLDYDKVAVGAGEEQSFTLENTGGTPVELTRSKPPEGSAFKATTTLSEGTTIKPGQRLTESVRFSPTETGPQSAEWQLNGGETDSTGPIDVHFEGEGVEPAKLGVEGSISFEATPVAMTSSKTLTLRNEGGLPLTIEYLEAQGGPFSVPDPPGTDATIEPGKELPITVDFSPQRGGTDLTGEIKIGTPQGSAYVSLSGSTTGYLQVEPGSLEFGPVTVGASVERDFTVTNTGTTTVDITTSTPPAAGPFTALTELPATVEPGATEIETVRFAPTAAEDAVGEWRITDNEQGPSGPVDLALSGQGILVPSSPPAQAPAQTPSLVTPLGGTSAFSAAVEAPPTLTRLTVRARAARGARSHSFSVGYRLSAAGSVELAVLRRVVSRRCAHGARVCDRWVATAAHRDERAAAGANTLTLDLAALAAGDYRLRATPRALSGTAGASAYVRFAIPG